MSIRKNPKADIRRDYVLLIEVGLVAALGALLLAFRLHWTSDSNLTIVQLEQERVNMEEIRQTQQVQQPPPPPRPPVPIEVPNDEVLDDDLLNLDATLDLNVTTAELPLPPPPPSAEEKEVEEPEIFIVVEQMPELIGGLSGLQKAITYPDIAKKAGVEGRVIIQFVVDERGKVLAPVIVRGIGAGCDEQAVRAVQKALFTPGMQRGKAVRVKMSLPVTFKLT